MCNNDRRNNLNEERRTHPMSNNQLYLGAIILGVLGILLGVLYLTNILGYHPTRAYVALGVGVILLVIGIAAMVVRRPKNPM